MHRTASSESSCSHLPRCWREEEESPLSTETNSKLSTNVEDRENRATIRSLKVVQPDSEIRRLFKDQKTSNLSKYQWLTLGESSIWKLLYFEFLTMTLQGLRGAIGIFLRQKLLPGLFQQCGSGLVVGRNVVFRHPGRIVIGNNVVIDDNVVIDAKGDEDTTIEIGSNSIIGRNSALVCKGGTIHIDRDVNVSVNCTLISESSISVGKKSLIAGHCYVIGGGNHGIEFNGVPFVDQPRTEKGGVEILENCWLGAHSTVLDGVTIGPDAIVGASALVNRSVPPQTVVAGVPAEVISSGSGNDQSKVRKHAR